MTIEEVVTEVERTGLPEALDKIPLSDLPAELREPWHKALDALDEWQYQEKHLRSFLEEARERAGRGR